MIARIEAIQNFDRRLAGVDRVRQRIAEIEKQIGFNGVNGEDFQTILNKEIAKVDNVSPAQKVNQTEKTNQVQAANQSTEIDSTVETFNASDTQSTNQNQNKSSKKIFPGQEALPESININPNASVNPRIYQREIPDEEIIETPNRNEKRISYSSNLTTEEMIEDAAIRNGIDSRLVKAVAIAESNMNQNDISDAGAIGVMQLMPETAAGLGVDPYDEQQNIEGGAKYLRQMLDTFGGNVKKAIAAYNAGPGAVQKYDGIPPYGETQAYVGRVMDLYR